MHRLLKHLRGLLALALPLFPVFPADIPIFIELDKPQYVTVVIENEQGVRVRNLVAEMLLPAGRNRLSWDGYDDGVRDVPFRQRHDQVSAGGLTRRRVPPGTYRARGLTHDGLRLIYEFPVYSGGNPPWPTREHTGAWMADHSAPLGAVFLPAGSGSPHGDGQAQLILTALIGEAGSPLVWVDTDGNTLHRRKFWGWTAGISATRNATLFPDPTYYAYLVHAKSKEVFLRGLTKGGNGKDILRIPTQNEGPAEPRHEGHSLAVAGDLGVLNIPSDERLVFVNVRTAKILGDVPMPSPRGLLFDKQGRLLVISDKKVLRFTLQDTSGLKAPTLTDRRELIATSLEDPRTLAWNLDESRLFVADWGASHQVKVFSPDGQLLDTIGNANPTGRQLGLYDERMMQRPLGLAVDDRNQLWVVEATHLPKRVSLWDAKTGRFQRAIYGPPKYGGGGHLHPGDKTRFFYSDYYGMIEFQLDWETGSAKPKAILIHMGNNRGTIAEAYGIEYTPGESRWGFAGDRPVTIDGRTYLVGGNVVWLIGDDHVAWPVGRVGGNAFAWPPKLNQALADALKREGLDKVRSNQLLIGWTDRNLNHKVDSEEYYFRHMPGEFVDHAGETKQIGGFVQEVYHDDLSMTANWALHVPAPRIDANGLPTWDLDKADFLVPHDKVFQYSEHDPNWGMRTVPLSDGWLMGAFTGWKGAQRLWTYPAMGADQPPSSPGEVVFPRHPISVPIKAARGEAGYFHAHNGEKGNLWLLTSDGLFLQTIGGDMRTTPLLRYPTAERGMLIDSPEAHVSFEDEHYNPTLTQTEDGNLYLVAGKEHSTLFRVEGMESVRRKHFASISLTSADLAALPETVYLPARTPGTSRYGVAMAKGDPSIDGTLEEFNTWLPIGHGPGSGQGAIRVSGDHLHAAWRTGDANALQNGGGDHRFLFKQGGAVDFMLRTSLATDGDTKVPRAGDLRVLIAMNDGSPRAVLFQQVAPDAPASEKVLYDSPIDSFTMERVVEITPHLKFAMREGDVEISLPLDVLGLEVKPGDTTLGDMGILRGNGVQTLQRVYWQNQNTLNVSDIPSEARLQPANWGTFEFRPALPPLPPLVPAAKPANAAPGLATLEFKGRWDALPDFRSLPPGSRSSAPIPTLEGVTTGKSNFALVFGGFLQIPADGDWTLILNSNDGSALYMAGVKVIDNDGIHWSRDESRTLSLKAGSYPIRVEYFQRDGGQKLEMRWKGPGTEDQVIPSAAFWHPASP